MASAPKQSQPAQPTITQVQAVPPPEVNLQTSGWGGMGYNLPASPWAFGSPQTGVGVYPPGWMQGHFAAPWWGQQAPMVGATLAQQQNPAAYAQSLSQAPVPVQPVSSPQVASEAQRELTPQEKLDLVLRNGGNFNDWRSAYGVSPVDTRDWGVMG